MADDPSSSLSWVKNHWGTLLLVFVGLVGPLGALWAWTEHRKPDLHVRWSVDEYRWYGAIAGDTALAFFEWWDQRLRCKLDRKVMVHRRDSLRLKPPASKVHVHLELENRGPTAANDVSIGVVPHVKGDFTLEGSVGLRDTVLRREPLAQPPLYEVRVDQVPPESKRVITLTSLVSSNRLRWLWNQDSLTVEFTFRSAEELAEDEINLRWQPALYPHETSRDLATHAQGVPYTMRGYVWLGAPEDRPPSRVLEQTKIPYDTSGSNEMTGPETCVVLEDNGHQWRRADQVRRELLTDRLGVDQIRERRLFPWDSVIKEIQPRP